MIDELELVKQARPEVPAPSEDARDSARRALDHAITDRAQRRRRPLRSPARLGALVPVLGALVAIGVAAVFLSLHGPKPSRPTSRGGSVLAFRVEPASRLPGAGRAALNGALAVIRERVHEALPDATVSRSGDALIVQGADVSVLRLLDLFPPQQRLLFYDWEANALMQLDGHTVTVASQLGSENRTAEAISQGSGSAAGPGGPGAGSMGLYRAVQLAARQPYSASNNNSRAGPEYFLFGKAGTAACAAAARYYHVTPVVGPRCYLGGPAQSITDLSLPPGVNAGEPGTHTFVIQRGTVVLQATSPNFGHAPAWSDPGAQFYVLRDRPALLGDDVINPRQSTGPSGQADVELGFTTRGGRQFQQLTAEVARRGAIVSGLGLTLNQHFAVALGTQLITVPSIDFRQYPDGIQGNSGAEITAGFTISSARLLAAELRPGFLDGVTIKVTGVKSSGLHRTASTG
jgi:SecD/SecF fusion protein